MKKKRLKQFVKTLGVPLLLMGTPFVSAVSSFKSINKRAGGVFISSRLASSRRQTRETFIEVQANEQTITRIQKSPFAAFSSIVKPSQENKNQTDQSSILDFLKANGLITPHGSTISSVSGQRFRKRFADTTDVAHCHYNISPYNSETKFTSTTYTNVTSCTNVYTSHYSGTWHYAKPVISGATSNQPVESGETITPFSGVTIADRDSSDVSADITLEETKGALSNLGGFTENGNGRYSHPLDVTTDVQLSIQGLVFTPETSQVSPENPVTTVFTITLVDPENTTTSDNKTSVITSVSNTAPPAPVLVSPTNGATVSSTVTLSWNSVTDADGDPVTYWTNVCEDANFAGCTEEQYDASSDSSSMARINDKTLKLPWVQVAMADDVGSIKVDTSLELWLALMFFMTGIGYATLSSSKGRKYLVVFMLLLMGMAACGTSSSSGGGGDEEEADMSKTISGLISGATYYWKVTAKDDNGGVTDSETYSFTVE